MWRRVRLIPFTRQFMTAEKEKDLPLTLKAEAYDILEWAVRGCLLWKENGMGELQKRLRTLKLTERKENTRES